jgi:predicted pyridoxine 5'-phosphate oxidase superfamily flavin-nucleotide-binding protein
MANEGSPDIQKKRNMLVEPFHAGELAVQQITGERDRAVLNGRAIGYTIPPGARAFVADQRYCVVGWISPAEHVWATFLTGERGFASTDATGSNLTLRLAALPERSEVPALSEIRIGDRIGTLFIQLSSRKRLRINGVVTGLTPSSLQLQVEEAFPNCPKYIQRREAAETTASGILPEAIEGGSLTGELVDWIRSADTFFVASAHPDGRVDASHRGGNPGFVKVENDTLWIPDYPGNSMFGTLGNFMVNPRGGLVFPDFDRDLQLRLTGDVRIELKRGEEAGETGGTGRWWAFKPKAWMVSSLNTGFDWTLIDYSRFNPERSAGT